MDTKRLNETKALVCRIRIETLKMLAAAGSGHVGGSLDLAELMAVLYGGRLRVDPERPDWPERDFLVLSKGHAGPVLYASLALKGFFPLEELATLNRLGTHLPSHCDRQKTRGVDMTAGSLGQGVSAATGIALGNRLAGRENDTYCIVGDGEMDEGSVWETMLLAPQLKLDHYMLIVDNNGLQIDGATREIVNLGDLTAKAAAFGWHAADVDGHDPAAIDKAIETAWAACRANRQPAFLNLHTVKAKGWAKYEGQVSSHYVGSVTEADIAGPVEELEEEIRRLRAAV